MAGEPDAPMDADSVSAVLTRLRRTLWDLGFHLLSRNDTAGGHPRRPVRAPGDAGIAVDTVRPPGEDGDCLVIYVREA
ncbi:MAG TPA: hypothetical protein VHJ17_06360 [Thermomonospora sp.]|nr:hypothetical protein [Thermomonospora sp.]